jgi:hypothetical protein
MEAGSQVGASKELKLRRPSSLTYRPSPKFLLSWMGALLGDLLPVSEAGIERIVLDK